MRKPPWPRRATPSSSGPHGLALSHGTYFGIVNADQLYTFDPTTLALGTLVYTSPTHGIFSVVPDPLSNDLYVSGSPGIVRVQNPLSGSPTRSRIRPWN